MHKNIVCAILSAFSFYSGRRSGSGKAMTAKAKQLARRGGSDHVTFDIWNPKKISTFLQPGSMVWYRFRTYPYWPAKVR